MLQNIVFAAVVAIAAGSYSDSLARNKLVRLSGATFSNTPQECLNHFLPNAELIQQVTLPCDFFKKDTCSGYVAVSHSDKAVVVAFRGTEGFTQLISEGGLTAFVKKVDFAIGGQVGEYFFNGYDILWQGGLKDSFLKAKNANPTYKIWVTGHSLGAAFATLAASVIVHVGYAPVNNVVLYTFGQPRVGDADFAAAHDKLGLDCYRVTHKQDIVPHVPPEIFKYKHHKSEVWYNNGMTISEPFIECDADEGKTCTDSNLLALSTTDHTYYFNHSVSGFGFSNCVGNFKSYVIDKEFDAKVNAIWKQKIAELEDASGKIDFV
uniref:Lipase_3 domain-containing protein n=1 Tax=Panagrellus redivivus TaxID=6233 RepID=A0A7E4WA12_PANRE